MKARKALLLAFAMLLGSPLAAQPNDRDRKDRPERDPKPQRSMWERMWDRDDRSKNTREDRGSEPSTREKDRNAEDDGKEDRSRRSVREDRKEDEKEAPIRSQGRPQVDRENGSQGSDKDARPARTFDRKEAQNDRPVRTFDRKDGNDDRSARPGVAVKEDKKEGPKPANVRAKDRTFDRDRPVRLRPELRKKYGIAEAPERIKDEAHIVRTQKSRSVIKFPDRDFEGKVRSDWKRIDRGDHQVVRTHMRKVVNNPAVINNINIHNSNERRVNHYYWHRGSGYNYCHYYDTWGYHWYGWYVGPSFFWTRYHHGRFWWYDPGYDRWCYWHNGYWWWPGRTLYVYVDNRYVEAEDDRPDYEETRGSTSSMKVMTFRSKDHTRIVRVIGSDRDAFLYDTDKPAAFRPIYLASGVKEVRFSDPKGREPLQVLLLLDDGTFEMYDDYGNPVKSDY